MKNNLCDIIRAAGMEPFASIWRNSKNAEARDMMGERSHFYSDATMAFFKCRVAWCGHRMGGIVMVAVMSQNVGFDANDGREWRYAVHDFTGHNVASGSGYRSRTQAEKKLGEALAAIEPDAIVRNALQREKVAAMRKAQTISDALRLLARAHKSTVAEA